MLDFNKKCEDSIHDSEKMPLIGIEPSGAGIRYVFSCGHGLIIQVVGDNGQMKAISDALKRNQGKSIDELYEELADFSSEKSQLRTASWKNKKLGELFFSKIKEDFRKVICDDLKFCKNLQYFEISIPSSTGVLIAQKVVANNPDLDISYVVIAASILMHLPLIKLKKWCNC